MGVSIGIIVSFQVWDFNLGFAVVPAIVMALVPLAIVLLTVRWINRWQPKPWFILLLAFLWGAGPAVGMAKLAFYGMDDLQESGVIGNSDVVDLLRASAEPGIIEELTKGLGVLVLFWALRRHFDRPLDGLVYGAIIGAGFAFDENIQYFGDTLVTSDDIGIAVETFIVRGVVLPFNHPLYTALTGVALGFAARRATNAPSRAGYFLLGLVPAMLLHASYDLFGSGMVVPAGDAPEGLPDVQDTVVFSTLLLTLLAIVFVVRHRRRERRMTADRLTDYLPQGLFTPIEIELLSTTKGRIRWRAWATRHGLAEEFRQFTRNTTNLVIARQRTVDGKRPDTPPYQERALIAAIATDKHTLAVVPALPLDLMPRKRSRTQPHA
jgi:protease PrsW